MKKRETIMSHHKKDFKAPVEKNKTYQGEISDLTHEGLGVAKLEHYPIFIEGALIGETIEFKTIKVGKSFGVGRLTKIIDASPDRVEIKDKAYAQSGTMPLQHLNYAGQLEFKKTQVENVMHKIAKLPDVPVHNVIGMENPFSYRNKAQIPVRKIKGSWRQVYIEKIVMI